MFNLKLETVKKNVFLVLRVIFAVLTFLGGYLVVVQKAPHAGYALIPALFSLVFNNLYNTSKHRIKNHMK